MSKVLPLRLNYDAAIKVWYYFCCPDRGNLPPVCWLIDRYYRQRYLTCTRYYRYADNWGNTLYALVRSDLAEAQKRLQELVLEPERCWIEFGDEEWQQLSLELPGVQL